MHWREMGVHLRDNGAAVFSRASWKRGAFVARKPGYQLRNPDDQLVLVVNQKAKQFHDYVPHSIDCRATDWEVLAEPPAWYRGMRA